MSRQVLAEGRPHTAPVPSSRYAYVHYSCRCDECREAHRAYCASELADRMARLADNFDDLPHGSTSTYVNWGCRCDPCKAAKSVANREAYARRKARRL